MVKSRTIKNSKLIKVDGDDKLNDILEKYQSTLNKVSQLDRAMDNNNVQLSNALGIILFNNYREYKKLRRMHYKLVKLKRTRNENENEKVNILLGDLENFLYKCQTGDVLSLEIAANTDFGNLVTKILIQNRAKGKKTKKRKKNKKKKKSKKK